ncbi:MAG TPA: glycosyltransferase [Actinomycetota bacterium]|nr:glycosyltransferase [Actinomycetota bacterium]
MIQDSPAVLRLITRLNVGGPGIQALTLTRELTSWPTVLAAGWCEESERELDFSSNEVLRVPLARSVRPIADVRAIHVVTGLVRHLQPEIIHTHTAKAGVVGRIAGIRTRPRPLLVHTFHGHSLDGYFGRTASWFFERVERGLATKTDILIVVSPEIRDFLLSREIGRPDQYRVLPLGVDLDKFGGHSFANLRGDLGIPWECHLVGIIGRLTRIKDHATSLAALTLIPNAHIVVVGDGELRKSLEQLASNLGIGERAHFLGWRGDIPEILSALDLVISTSRNEGTPRALIEAHASGRPAVATQVGGVPSVVLDGRTGFLVPPGDPSALASKVTTLLEDDNLRMKMGNAARKHVEAHFGISQLKSNHSLLYANLVASRGQAR